MLTYPGKKVKQGLCCCPTCRSPLVFLVGVFLNDEPERGPGGACPSCVEVWLL